MPSIFKIHMRILGYDTGLVRLSYICKHHIHHTNQESIIKRFTSVVNNWDNICAFFCHIYQISTHPMREFNGINYTLWSDDIRHVGYGCSWCSSEIENFGAWNDGCLSDTSKNWSRNFWTIRIPYSVLDFLPTYLDAYPFFIIDTFSWNQIFCHQGFLWASGDKHSWQTVWLNVDFYTSFSWWSATLGSSSSTSASSSLAIIFIVELTHFIYIYYINHNFSTYSQNQGTFFWK